HARGGRRVAPARGAGRVGGGKRERRRGQARAGEQRAGEGTDLVAGHETAPESGCAPLPATACAPPGRRHYTARRAPCPLPARNHPLCTAGPAPTANPVPPET